MKKLLLLTMVAFGTFSYAQSVYSENCEFLTPGAVGTDLTGATAGQGGWRVFAPTGTTLTDMSVVVVGGTNGNAFQITGSATATGTKYIYNDEIGPLWDVRDAGNDIAQVTYDFYTGPVSTSKNTQRVVLFDAAGSKFLGGMMVTMDTKVLSGLSYYDNAGTFGNYSFGLGATAATPIVLMPNTWYKMGFSFNKTTGEVKFKCNQGSTVVVSRFVIGASAGIDVAEIDLLAGAGTGNTASSVGVYFDNITIDATSTDTLLGTSNVTLNDNSFSVYPNPAKDFVKVSVSDNTTVSNITLTDINGRTVKNVSNATEINISDLSSGIYMMKISSENGSVTKKIIKE